MEKALCFGCYGENHLSKNCRKKKVCKKCNKPHPTLLHVDGFSLSKANTNKERKDEKKMAKVTNALADVPPTSNANGILLQAILPVFVQQKGANKSVKTYAFYDNVSAGCFITDRLKTQLAASCIETKLQLGTLHGQSVVYSSIVKELVVTDLHGGNPIKLPTTYTREEIPVAPEQIPELVSRILHLREIANEIPSYDLELDVGLLIGSNCPNALVPLQVVPKDGQGPFAVRLNHGWTVSGPLHITTESLTHKVTANRITQRLGRTCAMCVWRIRKENGA